MKTILFVCTGNTCRSPMAMAIFNSLAKEKGINWIAESAGTTAASGEPAAQHATTLFPELHTHLARQITSQMIDAADMVLCMGHSNLNSIRSLDAQGKAVLLKTRLKLAGEIADPFRQPLGKYKECATELAQLITALLKELA
jgi:protein-tyrosine phosphatase